MEEERNREKEETAKMKEEEEEDDDPVKETAQSPSESLANRKNMSEQEEGRTGVTEEKKSSPEAILKHEEQEVSSTKLEMGDLIPGLPDDLATECLIRMHFESFPSAALTCKKWMHKIGSPEYLRWRIMGGHSRSIVVTKLSKLPPHLEIGDLKGDSLRLAVSELKTGIWSVLPPIPWLSKTLPIYYWLVLMGHDLVVIGGNCSPSLAHSNWVYIYSFLLNKWRRGADMPDARPFFNCVSDSDRVVYLVGGYDKKRQEKRPALAYDVAKDEWVQFPRIGVPHTMVFGYQCDAVFLSGKLHAFSFFGNFSVNVQRGMNVVNVATQELDPSTREWGPLLVSELLMKADEFIESPVVGQDGKLYALRADHVALLEDGKCKRVADFPFGLFGVHRMMRWSKNLAIWGLTNQPHGERGRVYVLDLESKEWSNVHVPWDYCNVYSVFGFEF